MKLYNKKIIMKINFIQLIFTYKKMLHLKFSPQAPKVVELALHTGERERERERETNMCQRREKKRIKKKRKKFTIFATYPWCDDHSTSISACEVWGARVGVQVSKREFHTHLHLNQARVEFYLVLKKKKKRIVLFINAKFFSILNI